MNALSSHAFAVTALLGLILPALAGPAVTPADEQPAGPLSPGPARVSNASAESPSGSSFSGIFRNQNMTITADCADGVCEGWIEFSGQKFDFHGDEDEALLQGVFLTDEDSFEFTAHLNGDKLRFSTGGATHTLERVKPTRSRSINPLAADADGHSANPLAAQTRPAVSDGRSQQRDGLGAEPIRTVEQRPTSIATTARVAAQPAPLTSRQLLDGSGTIGLPAGWTITGSHQGAVDAVGPHGEVHLGIALPIMTPEAATPMFGYQYPLVAPYSRPVDAFRALLPHLPGAGAVWARQPAPPNTSIRLIRIVGPRPGASPMPGGSAAILHTEYDKTVSGRTRRCQGLSIICTAPIDATQWIFYASTISAPSDAFDRSLPTLLAIYSSWQVSQGVFQGRRDHVAGTLREIGQMREDVRRNRERAHDNANAGWSNVIRDQWQAEDPTTGRRGDFDIHDVRDLVEEANRQEGYARYQVVPFDDLAE
ncbi:MAG: hypothetical protein AMXMBFR13_24840 [Phycisphaerae bacterium]